MKFSDLFDCGTKSKKITFNRTFSLNYGDKESYYSRFVRSRKNICLNQDNDFSSNKYIRSFATYSSPIVSNFSTAFEMNECVGNNIYLPVAEKGISKFINEIFINRISNRNFVKSTWNLQDISNLFEGIRILKSKHRAYGSAGGLYPVGVYFFANHINGLKNGYAYKYQPYTHSVIEIGKIENINFSFYAQIDNLIGVENIKLMLFLVGRKEKISFKYGERGNQFALIESGEMIQNIALSASVFNYNMCQLGGYNLEKINCELQVDGINSFITACAVLGS